MEAELIARYMVERDDRWGELCFYTDGAVEFETGELIRRGKEPHHCPGLRVVMMAGDDIRRKLKKYAWELSRADALKRVKRKGGK